MDRLDLGTKRGDGAHQRKGCVKDVRGKVAHRTVRQTPRAPVRGCCRVGEEILGVLAPEPCDLADGAFGQKPAGELRGGCADVVEAHHVHCARGVGGRRHRAGVGKARAQRLLAEDRLAQCEGGFGDLAVCRLGRGDHDSLDPRITDQRAPVVGGAGEAVGGAVALGRGGRGRADHLETGAKRGAEDCADRRMGHRMGLAHVAAAHDPDADVWHRVLPEIPDCNRLQNAYRQSCDAAMHFP